MASKNLCTLKTRLTISFTPKWFTQAAGKVCDENERKKNKMTAKQK